MQGLFLTIVKTFTEKGIEGIIEIQHRKLRLTVYGKMIHRETDAALDTTDSIF